MGVAIVVLVVVIVRQRVGAQRQRQPALQHAIAPVSNPAFEPVYAAVNYGEVGNAQHEVPVPHTDTPQYEVPVPHTDTPQYDAVGFVSDQYAAPGPHSTYSSADTEA